MPLTGDGAEEQYVHLLGTTGVTLTVQCPDCKRDLMLIAQINSSSLAQDKDDAKSLSRDEESIVFASCRKPKAEEEDSYDLQSRLSDTDYELAFKRERRMKLLEKQDPFLFGNTQDMFKAKDVTETPTQVVPGATAESSSSSLLSPTMKTTPPQPPPLARAKEPMSVESSMTQDPDERKKRALPKNEKAKDKGVEPFKLFPYTTNQKKKKSKYCGLVIETDPTQPESWSPLSDNK